MTDPEHDDDDNLTGLELVDKGMACLPRNGDDAVDRDELRAFVAERMSFDERQQRLRRADALIRMRRCPGVTEPDGQLHFDGIEPYDYEPNRLVMGSDTNLVENHRAKPSAKTAEAERTMAHATRLQLQAQRRLIEATAYGEWAINRVRDGWSWGDITFGRFIQGLRAAG